MSKEKKEQPITMDAEANKLVAQVEAGKYDGDGPEDVAAVINVEAVTEGTEGE